MHDRELFMDGSWRPAREGRRATIADPATGALVGSTAIADAKDVDDAVAAAKRALPLWAGTHADERARILHRAADLIVERLDAIADLLTREQGKPIPDAVKEIRFGVDVIRYYAEEGRRIGGSGQTTDGLGHKQFEANEHAARVSGQTKDGGLADKPEQAGLAGPHRHSVKDDFTGLHYALSDIVAVANRGATRDENQI